MGEKEREKEKERVSLSCRRHSQQTFRYIALARVCHVDSMLIRHWVLDALLEGASFVKSCFETGGAAL